MQHLNRTAQKHHKKLHIPIIPVSLNTPNAFWYTDVSSNSEMRANALRATILHSIVFTQQKFQTFSADMIHVFVSRVTARPSTFQLGVPVTNMSCK